MKCAVLRAAFDPVTVEEIDAAKKLLKNSACGIVILVPYEQGILSEQKRLALLKQACAPYRKLACMLPSQALEILKQKDTLIMEMEDWQKLEETVRTGEFNHAAYGIRKTLVCEGLYFDQIVDYRCTPHRAAHSRSVASLCVELARAHHLNEKQAWKAGMMHDITKKWSDEEGRKVLSVYDPDKLNQNPKIWHSYTAPVWLSTVLGMHDAVILSAIYAHTLGFGKSDLARILYIADKCERTRGYDSEPEIAIAKKSLKAGASLVLSESKKYLEEKEGIHA